MAWWLLGCSAWLEELDKLVVWLFAMVAKVPAGGCYGVLRGLKSMTSWLIGSSPWLLTYRQVVARVFCIVMRT